MAAPFTVTSADQPNAAAASEKSPAAWREAASKRPASFADFRERGAGPRRPARAVVGGDRVQKSRRLVEPLQPVVHGEDLGGGQTDAHDLARFVGRDVEALVEVEAAEDAPAQAERRVLRDVEDEDRLHLLDPEDVRDLHLDGREPCDLPHGGHDGGRAGSARGRPPREKADREEEDRGAEGGEKAEDEAPAHEAGRLVSFHPIWCESASKSDPCGGGIPQSGR